MWDEKLHSSLFFTSVISHAFYVLFEATVWTYNNKAFEEKENSPSSHAPQWPKNRRNTGKKHGKIPPELGERNILITSALPYVNNVPHLGNLGGLGAFGGCFCKVLQRPRFQHTLYPR